MSQSQVPPPAPGTPPPPLWSDDERRAWAPPEALSTAEWAEKYRVLSRRQTSRPGEWRNANQPALVGLMNLCDRRPGRTINELWVKKSAQFGASEAIRNAIGRRAHLEPVPVMLCLPDEKSGRKIVRKRIIPLFEDTRVLKLLLTGSTRDKKLTSILLSNGFELSLAWAGSASAMASDPFALVLLDEVDKYASAGVQADPVGEARVRLRTYKEQGLDLLVALSTPSTPLGAITVGHADCEIKLDYYAPCPHCGTYQRLVFASLRWEKFDDLPEARHRAARIRSREAAWYECEVCALEGPPDAYPPARRILTRHKREMLLAGYWGTDDGGWKIFVDGREEGSQPEGNKAGIQCHALIDLSVPFHEVAAEFVECDGRAEKLKDFYNLTLGEDFKQQVEAATASVFRSKCTPDAEAGFIPPPAKVVPDWASRLLMTVDTQKDHFWYVIRAWGFGLRSQRVHHGRASSFDEIEELYYRAQFPYAGDRFPALRCRAGSPLFIDSGGGMDRERDDATRTDQVYQWCLRDPVARLPIKGASKSFDEHLRWRDVTYAPPNAKRSPYVVRLHFLDPLYWRDLLASYVVGRIPVVDHDTGEVAGDVDQWMLNDHNDEVYNQHLAAVHKVRLKKGRGHVERYVTKTAGAKHDYHDLEAYQIALAHGPGNCLMLPSSEQLARQRAAAQQQPTAKPTGVRSPDGRPFLITQRK